MSISLQQTRDSTSSEPDTFPIPVPIFKQLDLYQTIKTTDNTFKTNAFVLNHATQSILNGNYILYATAEDTYETQAITSVTNMNNTFVDVFDTEDFIDTTNTTGTGDYTTDHDYTLTAGEILQSKIIASNNITYTKATLMVEGTGLSDDTFYISGDGGNNWENVTNGTEHTFTNTSTAGIKYKIVNSTGSGFPTAWGTWGIAAIDSVITNIKLKYL